MQPIQLSQQQQVTLMALNRALSGMAVKVAAFMRAGGQDVSIEPKWNCDIPEETKQLRIDLVSEEVRELLEAIEQNDFIGIADGIADVLVVVVGTALAYGVPVGLVFDVAHDNNMTKIDLATGMCIKNEAGKILKPEGFVPADFKEPLEVWDTTIKGFGGDMAFNTMVLDGYMRAYLANHRRVFTVGDTASDVAASEILTGN